MRQVEKEILLEAMGKSGFCQVAAGGGSMLPVIRNGDWVRIERKSADRIQRGGILAFFLESDLFIHRIIRVTGRLPEPSFVTRGDSYFGSQCTVPFSQVLGVAVWRERQGRRRRLDQPALNQVLAFISLPISLIHSVLRKIL